MPTDTVIELLPPAPAARPATARRTRVLLSAYACEPHVGSEPGVGWETAVGLARTHEVWVMYDGRLQGEAMARELAARPVPHLHAVPYTQSRWIDGLRRVFRAHGYNASYYAWQYGAARAAQRLHAEVGFDVVQHVTFVRYWQPTFMWRLGIPLVWGPIGGGDVTPAPLRRTMSHVGRLTERVRDAMRAAGERDPSVRAAARQSAVCVATSPATAARLRALGASRVEISPECAIGAADLAAIDAAARARPAGGAMRVVSVGRLIHWKGYHLGLDAFAALSAAAPDAEYVIVGDGPERRRLRARARALGIADRVRFLGRVPRAQVLQELVDADVLLHPSLHDSGGWAVVEAMAAGLPVVCLDAGGPGERVTPDCGITVPLRDACSTVAGLGAALRRFADDPTHRAALGRRAAQRVRAEYTWAHKVEADARRIGRVLQSVRA